MARKQLNDLKESHSKSKFLNKFTSKPEEYLLSKNLTVKEIQTLFALHTEMTEVKSNFKNKYKDNIWCAV